MNPKAEVTEQGWSGTVEGVTAGRRYAGETVDYLVVKARLSHVDGISDQYGAATHSIVDLKVPVGTAILPGDLIAVTMHFFRPTGTPFKPALEALTMT